jgi:hypothetical protein
MSAQSVTLQVRSKCLLLMLCSRWRMLLTLYEVFSCAGPGFCAFAQCSCPFIMNVLYYSAVNEHTSVGSVGCGRRTELGVVLVAARKGQAEGKTDRDGVAESEAAALSRAYRCVPSLSCCAGSSRAGHMCVYSKCHSCEGSRTVNVFI